MIALRKSISMVMVFSSWVASLVGQQSPPAGGQSASDSDLQERIDEAVAKQLAKLQAEGKLVAPGDQDPSVAQRLDELIKRLPFELHGAAYLWHYEPLQANAKNYTELYYASLIFDVPFPDDLAFHFEPEFRDSKLRPFFASNVWVEQVYLSWKIPEVPLGTLKAGKEYAQFGHFWDGSFYGNLPYFDG